MISLGGLNGAIDSMFNWTIYQSKNATFNFNYFYVAKQNHMLTFDQIKQKFQSFNKSKSFCWAINNCQNTWTKRVDLGLDVIRNLPEKIHMWGSAPNTCFHPASDNIINHGSFQITRNPQISRQEVIEGCKFYFSFENSNCSGYISEKFSNAIQSFAIPIVNGWWESYKELLPGSFIHVRQFKTMSELGKYLDYLLKNETAFMEYHKWRTEFKVVDHDENDTKRECMLCKKAAETLASLDGPNPDIKTIPSLRRLFVDGTMARCDAES